MWEYWAVFAHVTEHMTCAWRKGMPEAPKQTITYPTDEVLLLLFHQPNELGPCPGRLLSFRGRMKTMSVEEGDPREQRASLRVEDAEAPDRLLRYHV